MFLFRFSPLRWRTILAVTVMFGAATRVSAQTHLPGEEEVYSKKYITALFDDDFVTDKGWGIFEEMVGSNPSADSTAERLRRAATAVIAAAGHSDTLVFESDTLRMRTGRLFDSARRHLYVRLGDGHDSYFVGLFANDGRVENEPLVMEEVGSLNFIADTLRDVNGDGFRDYVLRYYPSSGCCRRNVDIVHLYDRATGGFAERIEFINPTYYPAEGVVRGVEYGHPGEVALYKTRFVGFKVEQVECIYPVPKKYGRFIRGACGQFEPEGEVLDYLPEEYMTVEELEWFLSY